MQAEAVGLALLQLIAYRKEAQAYATTNVCSWNIVGIVDRLDQP